MQTELRKLFACVEQIIITSLEEKRYSFQVVRSIKILSTEMNISPEKLDLSVESLHLIDLYLNNLSDKKLEIELYLSITIYLSQILILFCNGVWSIEYESLEEYLSLLPGQEDYYQEDASIYSLWMEVYEGGRVIHPQYITMRNFRNKTSNLRQSAIDEISRISIKETNSYFLDGYELDGLQSLINEGCDFNLEIPKLICKLSQSLTISESELNKSVHSLKLIDKSVLENGEQFLTDGEYFNSTAYLALIVYLGEVLITAIGGEWRISNKKEQVGYYRWTIEILNSKGQVLKNFLIDMRRHLTRRNYKHNSLTGAIRFYIRADREPNKSIHRNIWHNTNLPAIKRAWKKILKPTPI